MEYEFINVQEMAKHNPDTFEAPNYIDLNTLEPGMIVKVCHNNERFWTIITDISGEEITAKVDNNLVNEQPFSVGEEISFTKDNIYAIWDMDKII